MIIIELNKIYNMDCISSLSQIDDNSLDLIFTDPPYKLIGGGRKNSLLTGDNVPFSNNGECFEYKTPEFEDWIPLMYSKLKNDRYIFIMTNDRNMRKIWDCCESAGFTFCELLVMNKGKGVPSTYFFKSCEFILMFKKGKYRKFTKFGIKTVFDVTLARGKNKIHPTEKPVSMIEDIIESTTLPNEIVFDPFMGSGSTAVAALNKNRNYLGFEIDTTYCNLSEDRILHINNNI